VARARPTGGFHLGRQVELFLTDFDGVASPETLYGLWIGRNDLRDAFSASEKYPTGHMSEGIILEAVVVTSENIRTLWLAGAHSFLVLNLPDIVGASAVSALGPEAQQAVRGLSEAYNAGPEMTVEQLEDLPEIAIARLESSDDNSRRRRQPK
jgi:phospholipase/lecithinase/hemolysin